MHNDAEFLELLNAGMWPAKRQGRWWMRQLHPSRMPHLQMRRGRRNQSTLLPFT